MRDRIRLLKRSHILVYGIIGCLIFASLLFVAVNNSNLLNRISLEKNCRDGIKLASDEAEIAFISFWESGNRAEPFEPVYIYCMLRNLGNTTASNISLSLLSKSDNISGYMTEAVQNCSPLAPSRISPLFIFPAQKSDSGNYSYLINVRYNYTSGTSTYQKSLNSTSLKIEVKLRCIPSISFYASVQSGITTFTARFYNYNYYTNLTYRFLIQKPNSAPEIFRIEVPGCVFNPNFTIRLDYVIGFAPDQLNIWDRLIYFWNGEIKRGITLFYQVDVNDTAGTVYPIDLDFTFSHIIEINSTLLLVPLSLEGNTMGSIWFILIFFAGLVGVMMIVVHIDKKREKSTLKVPVEAKDDKKVYVLGHLTNVDLIVEQNNILAWLKSQEKYSSLYENLKMINYTIIGLAITFVTFFVLIILSLSIQNFILLWITVVALPSCIIAIVVLNKFKLKQLKTVFPQYSEDHPNIEVIHEGTSIYSKTYKSTRGFIVGFLSYLGITEVLFYLILVKFLQVSLAILISLIGAILFALIFGLIFYGLTQYDKSIAFFPGISVFILLGVILTLFYFDPNQVPVFIPLVIFIPIFLLGIYLLNKLIYRIIEPQIIRYLIKDLTDYFADQQEIYLPKWTWISNPVNFPLLLKAISASSLNLRIKESKLVKEL